MGYPSKQSININPYLRSVASATPPPLFDPSRSRTTLSGGTMNLGSFPNEEQLCCQPGLINDPAHPSFSTITIDSGQHSYTAHHTAFQQCLKREHIDGGWWCQSQVSQIPISVNVNMSSILSSQEKIQRLTIRHVLQHFSSG